MNKKTVKADDVDVEAEDFEGVPGGESWIKKISAKTVCGKIEIPKNKKEDLFSIMGIANGTKMTVTQYGEAIGFVGDFEAVNIATGEVFRSPIAYIPDPAQGLLIAKLKTHPDVQFSFIVGTFASTNSVTGYEYSVRPINAGEQADALKALRAMTRAALPAPTRLPAPKAAD